MSKQIRVYTKNPLGEYLEWVRKTKGILNTEEERQAAFDEYYSIRNKNKFDILDNIKQ